MNCWWEKLTCFGTTNKILKTDGWNLTWSWKVAPENPDLFGDITGQGEGLGYEKVENKCPELEETVVAREMRCWRTRGVVKRKHYRAFDICRQKIKSTWSNMESIFLTSFISNRSIFHKDLHLSWRCLFLCIFVCCAYDWPGLKAPYTPRAQI